MRGGENFAVEHTANFDTRSMRGLFDYAYDQAGTIEAMRKRRIGVNGANALDALRARAEAQGRYRLSERRGDGVLEYAQRIRSSGPGKLDGLTASELDSTPGRPTDLLNQAFERAEGEPESPRLIPPADYAYRILTGQARTPRAAHDGVRSRPRMGCDRRRGVTAPPLTPSDVGSSERL